MFRFAFALSLCFFFANSVFAQADYEQAYGIRGGNLLGFTGKYFLTDATAVEALVGVGLPRGWTLCGLYELHGDIGRGEANWFIGAGGDAAYSVLDKKFSIGGDLIVGAEYTLPLIPLTFSADWKPYYATAGYGLGLNQFAVSVRYYWR